MIPIGFYGRPPVDSVVDLAPDPDSALTWSGLVQGLNTGTTSSSSPIPMDVNPDTGVMVVGTSGAYCARSTDRGATWSALTRGLNSGTTNQPCRGIAYCGLSGVNHVWVAIFNTGRAARSTDDGATWTALPQYLNSGILFQPSSWQGALSDRAGMVLAFGTLGITVRSTDYGVTWGPVASYLNSGSSGGNNPTVFGTDRNGKVIVAFATSNQYTAISSDNGANWTAGSTNLGYTHPVYSLAGNPDGVFMAGVPGESVLVSSNGGTSWALSQNDLATGVDTRTVASGNQVRTVAPDDLGAWVVSSLSGRYYRTLNNGATWSQISPDHLNSGAPGTSFGLTTVHAGANTWVSILSSFHAARSTVA